MKKLAFLLTALALLATGCGTPKPLPTPAPSISPSALPTDTATLTVTPLPPTLTATPILIDGTLTIKVNVRSGPGTNYDSLGQLEAGGKVQIVLRDNLGAWYQILYPAAPQGRGWVAAAYVSVPAGTLIPVDATPTPAGPTGSVIQRLNIRSGPGTAFDVLGTLEPGVKVTLTGKNTTASWFQIAYSGGPDGHGWVTSQYIQTDATSSLPVLDDYGKAVTPGAGGTPSGLALPPTATIGPATMDGDSSTNPAVRVTFSATGTRQFIYSSQVSAPEGDPEDWVEFTPFTSSGTNARLTFSLVCTGNSTLVVELLQGGSAVSGWGTLTCGDMGKMILVQAGRITQMRLAPAAGEGQRLVAYTLSVQNAP